MVTNSEKKEKEKKRKLKTNLQQVIQNQQTSENKIT
jgi:hypothetical protein